MTLEIKKARRKTFGVEHVQVTTENMEEVAEWCEGQVLTFEAGPTDPQWRNGHKYIEVPVKNPMSDRQKQAFVGDRVLKSTSGYKVYGEKAYANTFEDVEESAQELPQPEVKNVFDSPSSTP